MWLGDIPLDIINDILIRLPVKFLLRFRCVSKPWCSLIDSEEFVKNHLNRSLITNTNRNLILGIRWNKFSISLDSVYPNGVISYDYIDCLNPPPPLPGSVMLNSCNGLSLVLLKNYEPAQLYIWNPFTRKYRVLPPTPTENPVGYDDILNSLFVKEFYALAYVSETDEYKVVRVVEFRLSSDWLFSEAKIYSSTSNTWERIEDFPYQLISSKRIWGSAHLNGIVHTIVEDDPSSLSIMAFDVRTKKHAIVPNLDLVCKNDDPDLLGKDSDITIGVLGGCLCLIHEHWLDPMVDVWVMNDYGVKDSWFKLLSVDRSKVSIPVSLQRMVYSNDREEILLWNENAQRIYWYDLRTGTTRQIPFDLTYKFYIEVCFESLVSLPGFISVENVKLKSQSDLKKDIKEKRSNKMEKSYSWGSSLKKDFRLVL